MITSTNQFDFAKAPLDHIEQAKTILIEFLTNYGFKVFGAMLILALGLLAARWVGNLVQTRMESRDVEPPVKILLVRLARLLVLGLTLLLVAEKLNAPVTSLAVGLGTLGVGIGLAMQGVLGNLVAGLTIIFTKPFRVGEYIELLGEKGQVLNIELFSTVLTHADRSRVIIPNRKIVGEIMRNYGRMRQLDLSVGVAYDSDLNKVQTIAREILLSNPRVLKDPAPVVAVSTLGDFAVNVAIKPWVKLEDFGTAQAELNQAILERFRANHVEIPFPQREIRVLNDPPNVARI